MHEKPPGLGWIAAAAALILITLLAALFIPLKACPECEEVRAEFAEMGINMDSAKSSPVCNVCGGYRNKISLLKHWKYQLRHPS